MITISQGMVRTSTGVSRRDFLRVGGVGLGSFGLCLADLNALPRDHGRRDRAVILLMLVGGPSQLETWDPKPDAPREIRGPFGSIATRVPGVRISEHLPGAHGLLDSTMVVATGEFGRTPKLNAAGGRDHWPGVWSALLAGGGVRGGQVVGASDQHAEAPASRPVSPQELLATMYHSLGISPAQYLQTAAGESFALVEDARPIGELFS